MKVSANIALIKAVFLRPPLHDSSEMLDMSARAHRRKTVTGLINECCGAA
ncbi:hypothetical protein [Actinoallomurus sp. NPDC050550]